MDVQASTVDSFFLGDGDLWRLLASGLAIVLVDDKTGNIILATRPAELLFGYTSINEMTTLNVDQLVPIRQRQAHTAMRQEFYRDPQVRPMGGVRPICGQKKKGEVFPCEVLLVNGYLSRRAVTAAVIFDMSSRQPAPPADSAAL